MFKFEDLNVYQDALRLSSDIYKITAGWPKQETYGLSDQLRRAAVSIALNIAEGSGRKTNDFRHFLDMARGSCYECVATTTIAKNQGYVSDHQHELLYKKLESLSKMISALKKSLSSPQEPTNQSLTNHNPAHEPITN